MTPRVRHSEHQRQRARRDQRGGPDEIEVDPRATQDADAKFLEDEHRHDSRHRQIASRVQAGGKERGAYACARGVHVGGIVERLYRDIRALRIYEGATEIQRMLVGRELLKARAREGENS